MKLPVPQEVLDQLASTQELMGRIVEGLDSIGQKLDELIEIQRGEG